jgi:N-acetylglucosamine repressor
MTEGEGRFTATLANPTRADKLIKFVRWERSVLLNLYIAIIHLSFPTMKLFHEIPGSLPDEKRNIFKANILRHFYRSGSSCSISQLSDIIQVSFPYASAMIKDFSRRGWIVETGKENSRVGKAPVLYGLNVAKYLTLIVDINPVETQLVIFDLSNRFKEKTKLEIRYEALSVYYVGELITETERFLATHNRVPGNLLGACIIVSGFHSSCGASSVSCSSVESSFRTHFKLLTLSLKGTNAAVIGELRFGQAMGKTDVLTIDANWGIHLGIIANGVCFDGADGFAGDIGHIPSLTGTDLCYCGKTGCLSTVSSCDSLIHSAKEQISGGRPTMLSSMVKGDLALLEIHHLIKAAHNNDELSIDLLNLAGSELGRGLSAVVHLFNPQVIVIVGSLSQAGKLVLKQITRAINNHCLHDFKNSLTIRTSSLIHDARLLGAQSYLVEHLITAEFRID